MPSPDDNTLLAQFAGLAMQALIQRDHPGNPIRESLAREAYDAAELMLQEHKRRAGNGKSKAESDGQERGNG
jgi:hypothetical protein